MNARGALAAVLLACGAAAAAVPPDSIAGPVVVPLTLAVQGDAAQPNVTATTDGFVVTWQVRDGEFGELWFASLDAAGKVQRRGRVARGRNWFINWADFPSLVVLDNGDWVTHWLVRNGDSSHGYDIQLTRSTDRGRSWSEAVSPHTDGTPTQHGFVSLVPDGGDRVLVLWLDGRREAELAASSPGAGHDQHEESAPMTLRAAVLDRKGRRSGETLLDDMTCSCCQTDAVRWAGRTLVAYRDRSSEEIRDIAAVARGVDGQWSAPRNLHADNWKIAGCPVNGPALAVNGEVLLALWPTLEGDRMVQRYQLRRWDQTAETQQLDPGERVRGRVDAAPWGPGFLLTWLGGQDADAGPRLGVLAADGSLISSQSIAKTTGSRAIGFARVASRGQSAVLVWTAPSEKGQSTIGLALIRP